MLEPYTITEGGRRRTVRQADSGGFGADGEAPGLSYTGPLAELAEKLHMHKEFFRKLNPRADLGRPGAQIAVADVETLDLRTGPDTLEAIPPNNSEPREKARR